MLLPFDELDNIITKYTMPFYDPNSVGKERVREEIEDDIYELLVLSLVYGQNNVAEWLETPVTLPTETSERIIYRSVEGKTWVQRLDEYFGNVGEPKQGDEDEIIDVEDIIPDILRIAETETTRVLGESEQETAVLAEKRTGKRAMKTWFTMADDRVRDTHQMLEGVKVPANEKFWTFDNDESLAPGGFQKAQNNVGCRCWLEFSWE